MTEYSVDEQIITCMARELRGEYLVSSVTAFGSLAAHLAKSTHAPDLAVLSTPESGMDAVPLPTLSLGQFLTENQRAIPLTMEDIFDAIFTDRFRIWINPAQIDQHGNVNTSVIGHYDHPRVRLPGSGGANDIASLCSELVIVTMHEKRRFVPRVDFVTSPGFLDGGDARRRAGLCFGTVSQVITNLGLFGFDDASRAMRLDALHPGVTIDDVRAQTGFEVLIADPVAVTAPPTDTELAILRSLDADRRFLG